MDVRDLTAMQYEDLVRLAESVGIRSPRDFDPIMLINALSTYPNPSGNMVRSYIDESVVGNLIAFRTSDYKVKSAKIVKKSVDAEKLLVETKYGKQFLISFDDVVWVNTTGHWPRWVYNLLKGIDREVECEITDGEREARSE